jgi:hypothetical protein
VATIWCRDILKITQKMNQTAVKRIEKLLLQNKIWLLWLIVIVATVVGGAVLMRIPAVAYQVKISTTEMPEKLTELYFDNPDTLPTTVKPNQPVTIRYHIHNLEYQGTAYQVRVSLVTNGKVSTIEQKAFTLPSSASVDIPVTFTPTASGTNYELVVNLIGQNESILFRSHS